VAQASIEDLRTVKRHSWPSDARLIQLQKLAQNSIGVTQTARLTALCFEQCQLIAELKLARTHQEALDAKIEGIIRASREGRILLSIPPIGPLHAAAILATMGNIANFTKASELRKFFGWAPEASQTGTSFDRSHLTKTGSRLMKQVLFLLTINAIRLDTEWHELYQRLLPTRCTYDPGRKPTKGKCG